MMQNDNVLLSEPSLREKIVATLTRMYPLQSGCGRLANSLLLRLLAGERNVSVWADVAGGRALVPINDFVGRSIFFLGDLDPKISWVIDRFVRPGDVALDIGANLGVISLRLAERVGSSGQVHSFEPNPAMLSYLKCTLDANPGLPIKVHPIALGKEEANLVLSIPQSNAGSASLVNGAADGSVTKVEVPVRRLADFAAEHRLERIDFMKIDVEGFETEVLEGGKDLIARLRPKAIVLEEFQKPKFGKLPPSLQLLADLGYQIYALPRSILNVQLIAVGNERWDNSHDFVAVWPSEMH
jgi:FkbM family methyltransferase